MIFTLVVAPGACVCVKKELIVTGLHSNCSHRIHSNGWFTLVAALGACVRLRAILPTDILVTNG